MGRQIKRLGGKSGPRSNDNAVRRRTLIASDCLPACLTTRPAVHDDDSQHTHPFSFLVFSPLIFYFGLVQNTKLATRHFLRTRTLKICLSYRIYYT